MRVLEKTTENSERLGRQARSGFEFGTSRFPVLSVTTAPLVEPIMCQKVASLDFRTTLSKPFDYEKVLFIIPKPIHNILD